jgi:hypothetical protein
MVGLGLGLALAPVRASAQTNGAVFAGAEAGRDRFVYAGAVASPGPMQDGGWAVRGVLSAGAYDYESAGSGVDADYVQAEAVVLRQSSGAWGYLNVGAGARYTDTDLSPDDVGNDRRGGQWDVLATADGVRRIGAWEAGAYGSYGFRMREYFLRTRFTRAVGTGAVRLGVEAIVQGDPTYDRQGGGLVAVVRGRSGLEWTASAGVRGGEGYVSLGLVRAF